MPTPVPPTPETIAVYAPGASVVRMADSSELEGAKPLAVIAAALAALPQLSLVAITTWSDWRTRLSVGLASALAMPNGTSDGPVATIATCCGPLPLITKPPIITSLPVSTCMRVEMFARRGGFGIAMVSGNAAEADGLYVPLPW